MMLGRYLSRGLAGDHDPVEARLWLERAEAQGLAEAKLDLQALDAAEARRAPAASSAS
jgi:TPR repeat protein